MPILFQRFNFERSLFFIGVLSFLFIQIFGLYCGYKIFLIKRIGEQTQFYSLPWYQFIIYFTLATIFIFLLIKFSKRKIFFQIILGFLILWGATFVLSIFLPKTTALFVSIILLFLYFRFPNLVIHNLVMVLITSATGVLLGLSITIKNLLIILLILVIYDFIAVTKTKHMVSLFKGLVDKGFIMALVVPRKGRQLLQKIKFIKLPIKNSPRESFFVGTGDLAFPIIFSVSALRYNLNCSIFVVIGSTMGFALGNYILLVKNKPLPGLPFIVLGAVLGFILSFLF